MGDDQLYERYVLDNGLRIIISPVDYIKSVSIAFFIRAGGCYENENESGISHFIEHVCFKGTYSRKTSREICEPIEARGGIINGGTDKELTVYWCRVSSNYFAVALEILIDILINSVFDESEIEKEKNVIIEEINMTFDNPQHRVENMIYKLMWPNEPLGRDVLGQKLTVQSFNRDKMFNYYKLHYMPNNKDVSICENVYSKDAIELIAKQTENWNSGIKISRYENNCVQDKMQIMVENRDIEQVQFCIGFHGLSLTHNDRFAVDIISAILGDGMSSRLFTEVREKYGLVYEIGSSADHFLDTGSFIVHAALDPENINVALPIILEQIYRVKKDVTVDELDRAKEMIKGRMVLALESPYSISSWLGTQEILLNKIMSIEDMMCMIDSVSLDDIKRVGEYLIDKKKLNIALVGPIESEEVVRKLIV